LALAITVSVCLLLSGNGPQLRAQEASPVALAADFGPPPPDWFDPGTIAYLGTRFGVTDQSGDLWMGRLGDARLMPIDVPDHRNGWLVGDGGVVVTAGGGSGPASSRLLLVRQDGQVSELVDDIVGAIAVGSGGSVVYALRADPTGDGRVSGAWRVPLDGSSIRRILPPARGGGSVVVSPDERSYARGWDPGDEPVAIEARFDLGRPVRPVKGEPLGFDAAGRLVFGAGRYDPRTGRVERLKWVGEHASEFMPPGGRTLLSLDGDSLLALDLVDGRERRWDLAPGDWFITGLTTERHAVIARLSADVMSEAVEVFAVVDLREGWLGYVPFVGPE